jgi:hypothetical protein
MPNRKSKRVVRVKIKGWTAKDVERYIDTGEYP